MSTISPHPRPGRFRLGLLRTLGAVVLASLVVATVGYLLPTEGEKKLENGLSRNSAQYVTMRDGVSLAVDLWLPDGLAQDERVPTLLYFTRYGRARAPGLVKRVALGFGLAEVHPVVRAMNDAGFAVVLVDARGSGASDGSRRAELAAEEVADQSEVATWATQQPWSNGKVGSMGVSYPGTAAEMLAATGNPAVAAVAPLFSDFDGYVGLVRPGGVRAKTFIEAWSESNRRLDGNEVCSGAAWTCPLVWLWDRGIKPVDSDPGGERIASILRARSNYDIEAATVAAEFVDDHFGGGAFRSKFPAGHLTAIEQSGVPMQVWVGWLDAATVDGALARFNTIANPQELIIGPFNHGGRQGAGPFIPAGADPVPGQREQYAERLAFLGRHLAAEQVESGPSSIRYFTMGEGKWKSTDVWPPRGVQPQRWYLGPDHQLLSQPPREPRFDVYEVDFSATTGPNNRWLANLSGSNPIHYGDRALQDRKLLVYDSAPLPQPLEVTGAPVVSLQLSSSESDGAIFVYFEAVAPDGSVTYITEGVLRVIHRNVAETTPPYFQTGPYHSFKRADGRPLPVGETVEVPIGLISTSVQIPAGYQLRIAIGGHDASVFERLPANGQPVLRVHHGGPRLSYVDFPVKVNDQ